MTLLEFLWGRKHAPTVSTKIERWIFLYSFRGRHSNAFHEF